MISARLYYGEYLSQYDVRALVSGGNESNQNSQLLLGVNDTQAAAKMHLNAAAYNTSSERSTNDFLSWVKGSVLAGHPVLIGVFMNGGSDPDYDHIVPVTGITSNYPLTSKYYASDQIIFNDNGEAPGHPVWTINFSQFQANRRQANQASAPAYTVNNSGNDNYGIAITGIKDLDHETVPVRVDTNLAYELPAIKDGSNTRPAPEPLTLTVTVSGLKAGTTYNLYRYSSLAAVPDSAFNASALKAAQKITFIAPGATYVTTVKISSDQEAAFRAVPAIAK